MIYKVYKSKTYINNPKNGVKGLNTWKILKICIK